jgi:hypothetical protein
MSLSSFYGSKRIRDEYERVLLTNRLFKRSMNEDSARGGSFDYCACVDNVRDGANEATESFSQKVLTMRGQRVRRSSQPISVASVL